MFNMRKFCWGLAILVFGGLLWAENLGFIELSFRISRDWPVLLLGLGLLMLWDAVSGRARRKEKIVASRRAEAKRDVSDILAELERGEIDAHEAARRMGRG